MSPRDPFATPPKGLRTRPGARGLRVWWEPNATEKAAGMNPVSLDAERPTWSIRKAREMNRIAARATKGAQAVDGRRTVAALTERYLRHGDFRDRLRPSTQTDYRNLCRRVAARMGHKLVKDVTKPDLYAWYEDLRQQKSPRTAQALIRMASVLFSHAEKIGWRGENTNPALNMKLEQPKPATRVATWEEVDALVTAADALDLQGMALAITLGLYTAQRQGDILDLRAEQITRMDGPTGPIHVLALVRAKRNTAGHMPIHPDAVPRLTAALDRLADQQDHIITDPRGRAYGKTRWRDDWLAVRARAAMECPSVETLEYRDLRRTFGVLARAQGTSRDDVTAVLGNTADIDPRLFMTYMPPDLTGTSRAVQGLKRRKT